MLTARRAFSIAFMFLKAHYLDYSVKAAWSLDAIVPHLMQRLKQIEWLRWQGGLGVSARRKENRHD
jgi:hypothetical protein